MTFNIRGFYHPDDGANQWQHREALHFATMRRCAPDLIGVQEAQTGNLKAYHRELPDYHWMAWPEYGDAPPHEWPAIYWRPERLRPIDSGGFWLSETPERHSRSWETDCIRSAAWVKFRCVASGATIVHVNTHLDHRSELARVNGARADHRAARCAAAGWRGGCRDGRLQHRAGSAAYRLFTDAGSWMRTSPPARARIRTSRTRITAGAGIRSIARTTRRSASTGSCCATGRRRCARRRARSCGMLRRRCIRATTIRWWRSCGRLTAFGYRQTKLPSASNEVPGAQTTSQMLPSGSAK